MLRLFPLVGWKTAFPWGEWRYSSTVRVTEKYVTHLTDETKLYLSGHSLLHYSNGKGKHFRHTQAALGCESLFTNVEEELSS